MNAVACAPCNGNLKINKFTFDFKKLQANVKKLQTRIVKAQQMGRRNKVKALQWLLTHSFSAKILAVKRVTENKGKNTPGIDKVIWKTDKQKCEAVKELKRAGYTAEPLRRVFIPKKNGKKRPLGIPTKTVITNIKDGFDFLGQNIRKYKGKVLVKPSKENTQRFLDKIRGVIKKNLTVKQEELIDKLNPKIRGWANYHRHIVAKETFSYVDYHIYYALQRWCKRRHPKKGKWWRNTKYFHRIGTRNWVFAAKAENGEMKELLRADATKIIRHIKIRKEANPYDPEWDVYFEEREGDRMFGSMTGRKRLKEMWKKQSRKCLICENEINKESGWKIHIEECGKKVIIHPGCHERVHSELTKVSCTG